MSYNNSLSSIYSYDRQEMFYLPMSDKIFRLYTRYIMYFYQCFFFLFFLISHNNNKRKGLFYTLVNPTLYGEKLDLQGYALCFLISAAKYSLLMLVIIASLRRF